MFGKKKNSAVERDTTMGWGTWRESMQMGFVTNEKVGSEIPVNNEDGLDRIQPKIDPVGNRAQPIQRFKKTYRRR
jgi:hypothetical protein